LSHDVFGPFVCDIVKSVTTEQQHLLMTHSTEYRKKSKMGFINYSNNTEWIYFAVHIMATWVILKCALHLKKKFFWKISSLAFCAYTIPKWCTTSVVKAYKVTELNQKTKQN